MKGKELLEAMGFRHSTGGVWVNEYTGMHHIENDETITPEELVKLIKHQGRLELMSEFRKLIGA